MRHVPDLLLAPALLGDVAAGAAIAGEAAVRRLERGHSAELPLAGCGSLTGDGQDRIAKGRANGERALDAPVDAIVLAGAGQ